MTLLRMRLQKLMRIRHAMHNTAAGKNVYHMEALLTYLQYMHYYVLYNIVIHSLI